MADIQTLPAPAREKKLSQSASIHLDAFRGLAAIAVLIGHARNLFLTDWVHVQHKGLMLESIYSITVFGHQAVMIFFVLSGLLVGSSVVRSIREQRWSTARYLVHRVLRLEIVLLPALLLCVFWDLTGIHFFGLGGIYGGHTQASVMGYNIRHAISLKIFWGNVAFLQSWHISVLGSDNPLWSLANEFWYYQLFPCLALLFAPRKRTMSRIIYGTLLVVIAWFIGWGLLSYFPIWLLGTAIFFLPRPRISDRVIAQIVCFAGLIFIFNLALVRIYWKNNFISDYSVGITFAFVLYWILHWRWKPWALYAKASHTLAESSYTLYVVHLPFLVFVSAVLGIEHRWDPTSQHVAILIFLICAVWIYSFGVFRLFESHTNTIRSWAERKLHLA